MANNRDESELTFEGMTARVRRFLTRVYRFPHDWGVPEPQTPENDDAIIHRRMEELRIYGCSPVRASSRLLGRNSIASGSGRPAPSRCSSSANTDVGSPHSTAADSRVGLGPPESPDWRAEARPTNGCSSHAHEQREGAGDPSRRRRNITEQFLQKRPRLFRHDAKRLKRLIASAEHMIRCLIIWRAYRAMRDETITARYFPPPPGRSAHPTSDCAGAGAFANANNSTEQNKKPSIHPHFAVRGLPLYEPRAPVFRISMPLEFDRSSLRRQGSRQSEPDSRLRGNERGVVWGRSPERVLCETQFRENKPKRGRPRNDDLSTHERLYLRLERLGQLYEEVDQRGARLASRWAGYVQGPGANLVIPEAPQAVSGTQGFTHLKFSGSRVLARDDKDGGSSLPTSDHAGADALSRRRRAASSIRPLKSHDPPPDLLETAAEDEAEDLHILHDAAIRAAEDFPSLCG